VIWFRGRIGCGELAVGFGVFLVALRSAANGTALFGRQKPRLELAANAQA
jgi:hypothetical protein